jgi:hypothetical protein
MMPRKVTPVILRQGFNFLAKLAKVEDVTAPPGHWMLHGRAADSPRRDKLNQGPGHPARNHDFKRLAVSRMDSEGGMVAPRRG